MSNHIEEVARSPGPQGFGQHKGGGVTYVIFLAFLQTKVEQDTL